MFDGLKLRKRLIELEEQMLKLTRLIESHDLEWSDMRARCKRLLDRTEKAARRLEPEVESESTETPATSVEGQPQTPGLALSPSQVRLNQQILKMRRTG